MDPLRYYLALALLVMAPPALLTWLVLHPLAHRLRRIGPIATYGVLSIPNLALAVALFRSRGWLLSLEFGTQPGLIAVGVLISGAAIVMALQVRKQLTLGVLIGLPEIDSRHYPGELLTGGIYAWIRHPRYTEALLGMIGWSLVVNYLALYVMDALLVPILYAVVHLEEKELRERFGAAYEDYSRRVPRFIPRRRRDGG